MVTRVRITPKLNFCPKFCQKRSFKFNFNHIKCLVPNCPGAKLSGAKLSWCQIVLGVKLSSVSNCPRCQIVLGVKLSSVSNCPITIFKNCHHFTHKSVQKCNFGFYSITGNYTNEIRLKVCQKSNISEKNMVANFGFNCKNGKVSPIFRLHTITQVRITPKLNFCPKFAKNDLLSSI